LLFAFMSILREEISPFSFLLMIISDLLYVKTITSATRRARAHASGNPRGLWQRPRASRSRVENQKTGAIRKCRKVEQWAEIQRCTEKWCGPKLAGTRENALAQKFFLLRKVPVLQGEKPKAYETSGNDDWCFPGRLYLPYQAVTRTAQRGRGAKT
jgi:hypothetical protein